MTVGFIGLGVMGRPMALNLLGGGHKVRVFARRPDTAVPPLAAGARADVSPARLAAASNIVVTMVTATKDVEQVMLGRDGIVEGAAPGTVAIDMSTISPMATRPMAAALAERGVHMLDAPVSGGPAGAHNGTLTIMVGGVREVLDRVTPILACLGTNIVHMGPNGAGQITKACNQLALLLAAEGVAEAFALAARCGLQLEEVRRALLGGLAASRVLEVFGGRMVDRQFAPGIEMRMYHKDLGTVLELARESALELPAAGIVMEHLEGMIRNDYGNKDLSALLEWLERTRSSSRQPFTSA